MWKVEAMCHYACAVRHLHACGSVLVASYSCIVAVAISARTFFFFYLKFTDCGKSLFAPVSPSWEFRWPIRSRKSATPEVCSSIVMYRSFRSTEEGAHPVPAQETVAVCNPLGARWQDVVPGQARTGIAG